MYTRSQKQLAEERTQVNLPKLSSEDISKKMREKFAAKMKKMNELKEKQRTILSSSLAIDIVRSESKDMEKLICAICKEQDKP
jgi:ABC-type phosphate/phosphonate transport system substrate-binding protein